MTASGGAEIVMVDSVWSAMTALSPVAFRNRFAAKATGRHSGQQQTHHQAYPGEETAVITRPTMDGLRRHPEPRPDAPARRIRGLRRGFAGSQASGPPHSKV